MVTRTNMVEPGSSTDMSEKAPSSKIDHAEINNQMGLRQRTRRNGLLLTLLSATIFSTAGLFTKGVAADAWSVIFWRGVFAAIFTVAYICGRKTFSSEIKTMGKGGVAVALIGALGTAAFIPAFKLTAIANVSLIYATSPFVAGIIAWLWFRELPKRTILLSSLVAFVGVVAIVHGSVGGIRLTGDLLAMFMTAMISTVIVIYRRYPDTPAAGPAVLSSLFLLPLALIFGEPMNVPVREIGILAVFGVVFAVASVTLSEGARRLPSGEAALLSASETPLAPIWAWLVFSEVPSFSTLLGGAIILLAVFGSQIISLMRDRR
jgi:drug/metabolite transporter (DMT)-like permease